MLQLLASNGGSQEVVLYEPHRETPPDAFSGTFINSPAALSSEIRRLSHFVVCIGGEHGLARWTASVLLKSWGLTPLSLAHPTSYLDESASMGEGGQLMARATVGAFTQIDEQSIVNTAASVDHDCTIGRGVHVMGAAAIASFVTVHDYSSIGTNATVLPGITVGRGAFVGAGAVVTRDIPDYTIVVGNPARKLRDVVRISARESLMQMWPNAIDENLSALTTTQFD